MGAECNDLIERSSVDDGVTQHDTVPLPLGALLSRDRTEEKLSLRGRTALRRRRRRSRTDGRIDAIVCDYHPSGILIVRLATATPCIVASSMAYDL